MTDWVTLDTNGLLPGEPWTSAKALAVYENAIALAEGASGAPRIQNAALQDGLITTSKIANGNVTPDKFDRAYVRQGGGQFMASNDVFIGWDGPIGRIRAQIDATPQGFLTTRDTVGQDTALLAAGAVGTYAFAREGAEGAFGGTVSANLLSSNASSSGSGTLLNGTWRRMGTTNDGNNVSQTTLWLRIA